MSLLRSAYCPPRRWSSKIGCSDSILGRRLLSWSPINRSQAISTAKFIDTSETPNTGTVKGPRSDAVGEIVGAEASPGPDFNVLIVGAGNINFGSSEGPWNHSKRLEQILGPRLKVIGLIDPSLVRAQSVLQAKSQAFSAPAYADTKIFESIQDAVKGLKAREEGEKRLGLDLIVLGSPPGSRGRTSEGLDGKDAEIQLAKAFGGYSGRNGEKGVTMLVEKPVSTASVEEVKRVAQSLQGSGMVVGVGYMLRYCKAVQEIKSILSENGLSVMMTSARYIMAYEHSVKSAWWNKSLDCGPIVEKATHFCDLSRYFGGEVDLQSVVAHSVEWYETPGKLSKIQIDESQIPESDRIPRFTSASWKYENGAIGHLEHGVSLQGTEFNTELVVYADGWMMKLVDPYNRPTLHIRRPGSDAEEIQTFYDDDAFHGELTAFVDVAMRNKISREGKAIDDISAQKWPQSEGDDSILSSYDDAVKTYELTWAIRDASEKTRVPRKR